MFTTTSPSTARRRPAPSRSLAALVLICALSLTGCSTISGIMEVPPPKPGEVVKPRVPSGMKVKQLPLEDGRLISCVTAEGDGDQIGVDCDWGTDTRWDEPTPMPEASPGPITAE